MGYAPICPDLGLQAIPSLPPTHRAVILSRGQAPWRQRPLRHDMPTTGLAWVGVRTLYQEGPPTCCQHLRLQPVLCGLRPVAQP